MRRLLILSVLLVAMTTLSWSVKGQESSQFSLGWNYYKSLNSELYFISPVDTLTFSKNGKGTFNTFFLEGIIFDEVVPGISFGGLASYQRVSIGKITNDLQGLYDYRILYGNYYQLGGFARFTELAGDLIELNLGLSAQLQTGELSWKSSFNNNQNLRYDYNRFGVGLHISGNYMRPEHDGVWVPKVTVSGSVAYFPAKVIKNDHLYYQGEVSVSALKIIAVGNFYLTPVVGASIMDFQQVNLGFSPFISGGVAISSSSHRADLLKIYWQRRILKDVTPRYDLDGIYLSLDIAALFL